MAYNYNGQTENVPEVLEDELVQEEHGLVIYNDEINTIDFVIHCLETICELPEHQAEQCTYLIHYRGKCVVRNGSFEELKPMCEALLDNGLSATIE